MNRKKGLIIAFSALLVLAAIMLIALRGAGVFFKQTPLDLSKQIEQGDLKDIRLTIYYLGPFVLTSFPLSADDLKRHEPIVIVDGSSLEGYVDLLGRISNTKLIPVERESYLDARLCYVFESKKDHRVFEVAMWGEDNSMFVNGSEVKEDDTFYDIVMPFLPEESIKSLNLYLGRT